MPILNGVVSPGLGPLVDLWVAVSGPRAVALKDAGEPIPSPVRIRALIDTGASICCIDDQVISQLKIDPTGAIPVHTPSTGGTAQTQLQYDVGIIADSPSIHIVRFTLPVIACALRQQGIQALIGRDILDDTTLFYNGPNGNFSWSI